MQRAYAKTRMTAPEYAQLPPTNTPMERVEGEPVIMPSPGEDKCQDVDLAPVFVPHTPQQRNHPTNGDTGLR